MKIGIVIKCDDNYKTIVEETTFKKASKMAIEFIKFQAPKIWAYHLINLSK